MIISPRPINKQCKQSRQLENRNDNSHNSRPDSRSAKIVQRKPGLKDRKGIRLSGHSHI